MKLARPDALRGTEVEIGSGGGNPGCSGERGDAEKAGRILHLVTLGMSDLYLSLHVQLTTGDVFAK